MGIMNDKIRQGMFKPDMGYISGEVSWDLLI